MSNKQLMPAPPEMITQLMQELHKSGFSGDIDIDTALRAAMSTDNSIYQITPDIVVAPRNANDLVRLLSVLEQPRFATLAVTGRGGGTGTNAQSLNYGLIVDLRRHMNALITFNAEEGWADVQPGMVLDDLNQQIKAAGWFFAPETSTSTRCTIGGMVSTDASGKGSRVYGKTSDNILGLEIAHPKGLLASNSQAPGWANAMLSQAEVAARSGRTAFINNTPKLNRRFTGYDLERACPEEGAFEWWRLFLGAEGTLGLISCIRVKLRRLEPEKRLIVVGFDSFRHALKAATPLLEAAPTAIEVMDETVQTLAEQAGILVGLPKQLRPDSGKPMAYTFIEINGTSDEETNARVNHCRRILAALPGVNATYTCKDHAEIRRLWAIRSAGVGLLGKVEGTARPIAFVEDTVVPLEHLADFFDDFLGILSENNLGFGIYGHVDVGCLHIRPALNIDDTADRERLASVSDAVFELTRKYGGIFWGEHGKGVRGAYLRDWIGPEAYQALQGVKAAFDPKGRYNPGKLVSIDAPIMGISSTAFRAFNPAEGDALTKAFRCNGNAQCLSYAATTPMCPSFKASADIRHSPKGRADALRAWRHARQEGAADLASREVDLLRVMDSCLGCKACASSCPIQVDIPSMRTAFYADYFQRHARSALDRLILAAERYSPLIYRLSPFLSPLWPLLSRLAAKMTAMIDLPSELAKSQPKNISLRECDLDKPLPENTVIFVQDWFTALFDPHVQRDVIRGFKLLGFKPRLLDMLPAGKAAYTAGDMRGFDRMARKLAGLLTKASATGLPLITFEPAFCMMLRQEYIQSGITLPKLYMPQEFLAAEIRGGRNLPQISTRTKAKLLSHCTEASSNADSGRDWAEVFAALGIELETPETGCCGMAGLFGHHKGHQDISIRLFDMSWREQINTDAQCYATGFSCRCQSQRLSGQVLRHPLALLSDNREYLT